MKHQHKHLLLLLCINFLNLILITGCQRQTEPISQTALFFDTVISITVYDKSDTSILEDCLAKCEYYEKLFSATIEDSDVWNINHAKGSPVLISEDTAQLLEQALYYADLSDGLVDPSIYELSSLWNFSSDTLGNNQFSLPEKEHIEEALQHIDYRKIKLNKESINSQTNYTVTLLDPDMRIDLGFIAKGYIADRLKENLESYGVKKAIINLGGNVLTIGSKPNGMPFQVGIQKPFDDQNQSFYTIEATDLSVVSSGNYQRYCEINGQLYHHILDPFTGYPVNNDLYSVTILSKNSTMGDALSTYCYILGLEQGLQFIESMDQVEAIFIDNQYNIYTTSGISDN